MSYNRVISRAIIMTSLPPLPAPVNLMQKGKVLLYMFVRLPLRRSQDPSLEPQGRKFMGNGHGASHRARLPKPPRTPPRGGPPRAASPTEGSRHERRPRALRISDVDDDHMIRSRPCAPTRAAPAASNWARRVSPQVSAPEQDRSRHPEENPPRSAAWGETGVSHRAA